MLGSDRMVAWGCALSKTVFPKWRGGPRILPPSQCTRLKVSYTVALANHIHNGVKGKEIDLVVLEMERSLSEMWPTQQRHERIYRLSLVGLNDQWDFTVSQSGATPWLDLCFSTLLCYFTLKPPTSCNHDTNLWRQSCQNFRINIHSVTTGSTLVSKASS